MKHILQKLKLNKFLKARNQLNRKLISMLFCLRKNHKVHLRKAFHKWARTEMKNKIKLGSKILETLIMKRKDQGMDSVKKFYYYIKYKNVIRGILRLIEITDGKINEY